MLGEKAGPTTPVSPVLRALPKRKEDTRRPSLALMNSQQPETMPAPLPLRPAEEIPAVKRAPQVPQQRDALLQPVLPRRRAGPNKTLRWAFALVVILPTMATALYLYFVASDQYQSEFRFSVAQGSSILPGQGATSGSASSQMSSLASAFGIGGGGASQQNFIVTDYALSRQAVDDLQRSVNLASRYSKPNIDYLGRLRYNGSNEQLWRYFRQYVTSYYDQVTGLAYIAVRAYSPGDARDIAVALSALADRLINEVNDRANQSAISSALEEDNKAQEDLKRANDRLTQYRGAAGTVNPSSGAVAVNVALDQSLQNSIIALQTQFNSGVSQGLSPQSPILKQLSAQIASAKAELLRVDSEISKRPNEQQSLAQVQGNYDQLVYEQQFAQTMATQTRQALLLTRANAAAQRLFIEPYVLPTISDVSDYPNRWLTTLLTFMGCFSLWFLLVMIFKAVQDHRN